MAAAVALALAGTSLTVADAAPAAQERSTNPAATPFALKSWGYGTRVQGGQAPAQSGVPAYEVIGCTNLAGIDKTNQVADVALPGLGTISGVKTRVWTTRSGGVVSSWAENTIGKVVLSDSPLGTLTLSAVSTTAHAFHDGSGFKTEANTDLARLQFKPPVGPAMDLPLPTPSQPVEIPQVGKVIIAHKKANTSANGAQVFANGLKIRLYQTGSVVRVAHAVAQIARGATVGVFSGESYAIGGNAAGDIVRLGRNPLMKMPCQGTNGVVRHRELGGLDLGGQVVVGAASSSSVGDQNAKRAWGRERSRVASINLAGALQVTGIVGQVNVARFGPNRTKLKANTRGSTLGRLIVNGETRTLPAQGLEIPGVAKLEPMVTTRIPGGIKVTALRITVLDGTGAVIELGNARLVVKRLNKIVH
ncbi:choice-of-anchor P family protein [Nocardioides hankookensis]|uniref:Choice-of-anchor P family protein n=1 Tax=Nocardioides hankookensis TaxID=443157 RepID=A0ABW1LH96_9ACTN